MVVRNVLALDDDPPLSQPFASHLCRGPALLLYDGVTDPEDVG
jgi:hypothetical protein